MPSPQHSILTFNMSVSDRQMVHDTQDPFQIMPATQNILSDNAINSYIPSKNPDILLHMNYITHPFSENSIENDSSVRQSLRQYVKLANKLGSKNILIHGPYTPKEWMNLAYGMKVIYDEIIKAGMIFHLEMPAWSSDFVRQMCNGDVKTYMTTYFTRMLKYLSTFPKGSAYIVPDTAHMFANGCGAIEDFSYIMNKFRPYIRYIHLNGNVNPMFKSDKHCPLFVEGNRIQCWRELSQYCADLGVICVAEITKIGSTWENWKAYAEEFGFELVEFCPKYSI